MHASVNAVCKTYDSLLLTFDAIIHSSDCAKAVEAKALYFQIKSILFITTHVSFDHILSCTRHLSDQLQSSKIDLGSAADLVQGTKSNLMSFHSSEYWNKLFHYIMSIAKRHSVDFPPDQDEKGFLPILIIVWLLNQLDLESNVPQVKG